jgi:hypothetical protein
MTEDVIVLLDYIGWTSPRAIHVVGMSLGGMIAQGESHSRKTRLNTISCPTNPLMPFSHSVSPSCTRAHQIPFADRHDTRRELLGQYTTGMILPLFLSASYFPTVEGSLLVSLVRPIFCLLTRVWSTVCNGSLMTITDPIKKIPILLCMIFPPRWIDEKAEDDAQGRTNRQVQSEVCAQHSQELQTQPSAHKEFARRIAVLRPQTLVGALSQMWAAWTHHVRPEQLKQIAQSVPKVLILTGDEDHMVSLAGSERLWEGLTGWMDKGKDGTAQANTRSKGGVDLVRLENSGHAVTAQRPREVNAVLEKVFREGNEAAIQADSRME